MIKVVYLNITKLPTLPTTKSLNPCSRPYTLHPSALLILNLSNI